MAASPEEIEIAALVSSWYEALDLHAPVDEILPMLAEDGLEMTFPEGVQRGQDGFRRWYETATRRFFDEVHTLQHLTVSLDGDRARVNLVVNWEARIWEPPAPRSVWLGFSCAQTWNVQRSPRSGRWVVKLYVVDSLTAMPGSAEL